jgi:poly-beta-hydroxyalkanoate depolymerase
MTREEIYQDYLAIKDMNAPLNTKISFLTYLFSNQPNPWRVTGITREALTVFTSHGFKKVSRMGINRSHIEARKDTYRELLERDFNSIEEWWDYYFSRDMTILSTSSENMSSRFSEIYPVDEILGLFRTKGYAWKHGKEEIEFLRNLAENIP